MTALMLRATSSDAELYITAVDNVLLDRGPDPTGLATKASLLNARTPRSEVANAITSSNKFRSQFISDAYSNYLGRTPDGAGLQFWLQKLREGWTLEQPGTGFLASDEFYDLYSNDPAA